MKLRYTLPANTVIDGTVISDAIDFNEKRRALYDRLEGYYLGKHDTMEKRGKPNDTLFNHKVITNHAKYIVDIFSGYLLGQPVSYQTPDKKDDISAIKDAYADQTISDLDSDLGEDLGTFGRAYEYTYLDEDAKPISVRLDVRNTIVAYDNTVKHQKMFAVNYEPIFLKPTDKRPDHYDVMLIDDAEIRYFSLKQSTLTEDKDRAETHVFKKVPVVEYLNNKNGIGDFEQVLSLIDAYNIVQSDRVNDREQLVDAILALYGMDFDEAQLRTLKSLRMISQIPADAKAEYITKNISEADIDVLRKNIETDIFKISMAPNMTDDNFVGNASGVAINYKLLPFEQETKKKERRFEKGLMERFELYMNVLQVKAKTGDLKLRDVDVVFTRSLPRNDFETSQMINNLDGIVDRETLVDQLSFVQDAAASVKKAQDEATQRFQDNQFGTLPGGAGGNGEEPES